MNNIPPEVSRFTFFSTTDRTERDDGEQSRIQLHNEELSDPYPFSDILGIIRLGRMKREGMWEAWKRTKMHTKFDAKIGITSINRKIQA